MVVMVHLDDFLRTENEVIKNSFLRTENIDVTVFYSVYAEPYNN